MAKNNNLTDLLKDVADAIRTKKSSSSLINPQDFSDEILTIQTGGGTSLPSAGVNDVTFFDYNGHILYSYSRADFLALTEMPELPSRNELVCTGWTHDLVEAQEYVSLYRMLNIGACYTTDNGRTKIYFDLNSNDNLKRRVCMYLDIADGLTIYWGDGTRSVSSTTGTRIWTHTYPKRGSYRIEIEVKEGTTFSPGYDSTNEYKFFGSGPWDTVANRIYGMGLKRIFFGDKIYQLSQNVCSANYGLEELVISSPSSGVIGLSAFENTFIKHCNIPSGVSKINGNCFTNAKNLRMVVLPNSLTSLNGGEMWQYCINLQGMTLPTAIQEIPSYTFSGCENLEYVIVPKSVLSIGQYAFENCKLLQSVYFIAHEQVPTASMNIFTDMTYLKIVVPDALYDEWIAATNWSAYASYIVKASEYFIE